MTSDFPKPQHPALPRRTFLQAGTIGILGLGIGELNALRAAETQTEITGGTYRNWVNDVMNWNIDPQVFDLTGIQRSPST